MATELQLVQVEPRVEHGNSSPDFNVTPSVVVFHSIPARPDSKLARSSSSEPVFHADDTAIPLDDLENADASGDAAESPSSWTRCLPSCLRPASAAGWRQLPQSQSLSEAHASVPVEGSFWRRLCSFFGPGACAILLAARTEDSSARSCAQAC